MICRYKRWSFFVLGLIFLAFTVSCSATQSKRSVGEVIDDAVISNKLKVKYLKDKVVSGLKVNIDTWKGVVTLKGKVSEQEQIDRAIELAERQPGVKEVKSYLNLKEDDKPDYNKQKRSKEKIQERDINEERSKKLSEKATRVPQDKGLGKNEELWIQEEYDEDKLYKAPKVTNDS